MGLIVCENKRSQMSPNELSEVNVKYSDAACPGRRLSLLEPIIPHDYTCSSQLLFPVHVLFKLGIQFNQPNTRIVLTRPLGVIPILIRTDQEEFV